MSYESWHTYGIGFNTDDIQTRDVSRLENLLSLAPEYHAAVQSWMQEQGIENPDWDDYADFDQDYNCGIGTLIAGVISEAENLDVISCIDESNVVYVLYCPKYPWQMEENERSLTEDKLTDIFCKYIAILTDESIDIQAQSVGNGS